MFVLLAGITVVGIGINIFERDEMHEIASKPSSKFLFQTYDYYNLNSLVPKVSSYICIGTVFARARLKSVVVYLFPCPDCTQLEGKLC